MNSEERFHRRVVCRVGLAFRTPPRTKPLRRNVSNAIILLRKRIKARAGLGEPSTLAVPSFFSSASFKLFTGAKRESNRLAGCCRRGKPMAIPGEKGLTPCFGFSGMKMVGWRGGWALLQVLGRGSWSQSSVEVWTPLESCSSLGALVGVDKTMGSTMSLLLGHWVRSAHLLCYQIPLAWNWSKKVRNPH